MTESGTLAMINIDCADPGLLAAFYAAALGWEVVHNEDPYALIKGEGAPIGFGRTEGHAPPAWPDPTNSKRFHLDLYFDSLESGEKRCVELGATVPEFQPGAERWRVLLDPGGHPFCVCVRPAV